MNISDFYNVEYLQSALYQSFRSIGNYLDGLKPSSRKIVYTVSKNNITQKVKSSQLCSKVAEQTQYLHGEQSLAGVVVGLARDYVGSNNINILKPDGNFGTRFVQEAAAARYIYTYKSDMFDTIFHPDDEEILEEQFFEGEKIEYKYYMPVVPLILVNGSEGIGNGFAQKILPRSVEDVKEAIKLILAKKDIGNLKPYFKGFNGEIVQGEEPNKWIIKGKFEKIGVHKIKITEVPIGYDLKAYLDVLDDLVDKKIIRDYEDNSNEDSFNFTCSVNRNFYNTYQSDDRILDTLKLKKLYTENYTCVDDKNAIIEFNSVEELLRLYVKRRVTFYSKRKKYLVSKIDRKIVVASNKVKFVESIIEESSILMNKKRKDIESWLESESFDKIDNSYDYLLRLPAYSFTQEKVKELNKELENLEKELEALNKKTTKSMWVDDLKNI